MKVARTFYNKVLDRWHTGIIEGDTVVEVTTNKRESLDVIIKTLIESLDLREPSEAA